MKAVQTTVPLSSFSQKRPQCVCLSVCAPADSFWRLTTWRACTSEADADCWPACSCRTSLFSQQAGNCGTSWPPAGPDGTASETDLTDKQEGNYLRNNRETKPREKEGRGGWGNPSPVECNGSQVATSEEGALGPALAEHAGGRSESDFPMVTNVFTKWF